MQPTRRLRFDRAAGLLYSPIEYDYPEVTFPQEVPTVEWTAAAVAEFVRGEFGSRTESDPPLFPGMRELDETKVTRELPHIYLEECEKSLVYGPYLTSLISDPQFDTVDNLYRIICDPTIGNKANSKNVSASTFRSLVEPHLRSANRLRFVMPAFPFKDQNPFRSEAPPSSVDMGELALMIRLHAWVLAFYQVDPHGADFILITDGKTYAEIFGISLDDVQAYRDELIHWRNELNLEHTISIVDLDELVSRCNHAEADPGRFRQVRSSIRSILESLVALDGEESARSAMAVLQRGMAWNLDLRRYISRISHADLWCIVRGGDRGQLPSSSRTISSEIDERAMIAAIEYASFNLAIRYLDVFSSLLPTTLRATIHAKPGQIAAPSLGTVFPWNGVPIVDLEPVSSSGVRIMPVVDAMRKYDRLKRCSLPGSVSPFAYSP